MTLKLLALPILILIGIITSYQDFKYNKIFNHWILLGFIWGVFIHILLLFTLYIPENACLTSPSYTKQVVFNFMSAISIGFLLWKYNFWAAGDAKLFAIFAFLLPLSFYSNSYFPIFPSFALLINIFFIFITITFFKAVVFIFKKHKSKKIKYLDIKIKLKNIFLKKIKHFKLILFLFLFFNTLKIILKQFFLLNINYGLVSILYLVIIFLLKKYILKIFKKTNTTALLFSSIFFLFFYSLIFDIFLVIQIIQKTILLCFYFFIILTPIEQMLTFYLKLEEKNKKKKYYFASWLFSGLILTIISKGSILNLIFNAFK